MSIGADGIMRVDQPCECRVGHTTSVLAGMPWPLTSSETPKSTFLPLSSPVCIREQREAGAKEVLVLREDVSDGDRRLSDHTGVSSVASAQLSLRMHVHSPSFRRSRLPAPRLLGW